MICSLLQIWKQKWFLGKIQVQVQEIKNNDNDK